MANYSITAKIAHYTAGLITSFSFLINNILPILLFTLFLLYEVWEALKIHDTGYLELKEYAIGAYTGAIILFLLVCT